MARQSRAAGGGASERRAAAAGQSRRRLLLLALAALTAGATVAGLAWMLRSRPPRTDAEARARLATRHPRGSDLNLVVITLDTTRADRLGCYGFRGVETPNLDALAADGVVFEQATSTVPLTLPSHTSIFTGLIPPHHGVRDNGGYILDPSKTTLAERLKAAGWTTGAFIGAWVLDSRWGLAQGFDNYSDKFDLSQYKTISLGTVQKKGDEVMDLALDWLQKVKSKKFFAWVHLYDPHTPYDPPEPFLSRYRDQKYVGEIAYTDHVVGRLLSFLREERLWDRTLVVVLGDHGESLGEHGESTHAYFVYDATVHVPLIVRTPWGDRGRARAQVSTVDVVPTVLDLLGLPPEKGIDGRTLVRVLLDPAADPGHVAYSETYFPRFHFGWQHLRSLRNGRFKYIEAPKPELYELDQDPGETNNVYRSRSARAEELRLALERIAGSGAHSLPERQSLDPDTLQRLAALGYVGNAVDVDPEAVLPDPKDKIRLFSRMAEAKALAQDEEEDRLDEAIAKMRSVVAEDPQIIDAYVTLGNWLRKKKKNEEAIAAFKQALALKPDNELALGNLANLYREMGRSQAALEGYRSVLELEPRNPQTWYQLATLYLDLGRVSEAENTFKQALKYNPDMGAAYNSLAAIAFSRGDLAEAERLVRQGLALEDDLRSSHFNLGRILEARGDLAGAKKQYQEELSRYSDHGRARFNLAQILRQEGDRAGYLAELRESIEKAPGFGAAFFFLAREELGAGRLDSAADLARRGLEVDSASEVAPLGYYVLADVYNRQGRRDDASREVEKAHRLEAALRRSPSPRI
jgi:arylsulfatase A-like enzyme/Tfp pilus assembly protein PilF